MAFSDIVAPPERAEIIKGYEDEAAKVNSQYDLGLLTEEERRQELINLWTECTDKVAEAMRENFHDDNNVNIMVQSQYDLGLLTEEERRQELINLWTECTDKVAEAMRENFHDDNNVNIMVQSGARGNWMQIRQIAGMRGLGPSAPTRWPRPCVRTSTTTTT